MQPGQIERRTHDYKRHGTTITLFAALEIATGGVTAAAKPRHATRSSSFLEQIDRTYGDRKLHLVKHNYATHKKATATDWLATHPNIHVHFTPTSGLRLNLVEVCFGIIDPQAIRRGVFTSVKDLNAIIQAFERA